MSDESAVELVARCENYVVGDNFAELVPCTGNIRFRWGQTESRQCTVCGDRCRITVWEPVKTSRQSRPPESYPPEAVWLTDERRRAFHFCRRNEHLAGWDGPGLVCDAVEDALAENDTIRIGWAVDRARADAAEAEVRRLPTELAEERRRPDVRVSRPALFVLHSPVSRSLFEAAS